MKTNGYEIPKELEGIGPAIDWLGGFMDDQGDPPMNMDAAQEVAELVKGLETAMDYLVKIGVIKFDENFVAGDKKL